MTYLLAVMTLICIVTMQRNNSKSSSRRRQFLKTTGAATAALMSAPTVSAKVEGNKPTINRYNQGLEKRKKNNWDVHKWRHWLANHGFDFQYQDVGVYTPTPDNYEPEKGGREWGESRTNNKPSKDSLLKSETYHYMTYTRPSDSYDRFNFEWSLNDGWATSGASPVDRPGMSFEEDFYNFPNDPNYDLGNYVSGSDRGDSVGPGYWSFEYDDDSHAFNTTGRFESNFDMPLYVQSSSEDIRQIYTRYHHTWDYVNVSSIGVDSGGVFSVSFEDGTDSWSSTAWCEEEDMDSGETYTDKQPE